MSFGYLRCSRGFQAPRRHPGLVDRVLVPGPQRLADEAAEVVDALVEDLRQPGGLRGGGSSGARPGHRGAV